MRAGFGDTPGSLLAEAQARCDRVWTRKDTLASIPAPIGKPGGSFAYSNPTYKLLGYAAEHVTGTKLESAFEQQMFRPLGLDRILLQGSTHATPKPWALPIGSHGGGLALDRYGTGGTLPCVSLSTFSFATSAVASDAPSLARWAWGLFSGALIDLEYLDDMTTPFDGVHGMALELLPSYAPNLALGVHGGQVGYAAFLAILPERQAVAALFINDQEAEVEAAARKLIVALGT
jgi:CubicO group peptidase (beta-lactamase class C family)